MTSGGNILKGNSRQGRQIESEDSESDSDGQPLASRQVMGKMTLASVPEVHPAISIHYRETELAVSELAATEQENTTSTTGVRTKNEKLAVACKKTTEKGLADDEGTEDPKDVSEAAPTASEAEKRTKKQRLVSYSSQDSGSDTGSRRSDRNPTKMGGVMT